MFFNVKEQRTEMDNNEEWDDVLVQWAGDFRRIKGQRMLKVAYSLESNHQSRSLLMKQESLFQSFCNRKSCFQLLKDLLSRRKN